MCKPINEGGMGIRLLEEFNDSSFFKRAWELMMREKNLDVFGACEVYEQGSNLELL